MGLKDWLKNGWLVEHAPSPEETRAHLGVVARDLQDCALPGLSPDRKLAIAYAAALQAATAALAAEGFRASRDAHHYRVIESLAHTLGLPAARCANWTPFAKSATYATTRWLGPSPTRRRLKRSPSPRR